MVSPISNSESTNICYGFFLACKLRKKNMFCNNKKFVFFFKCSNWQKFVEKFVKTFDEFIILDMKDDFGILHSSKIEKNKHILHHQSFWFIGVLTYLSELIIWICVFVTRRRCLIFRVACFVNGEVIYYFWIRIIFVF